MSEEINVQKIMDEIRENIKTSGADKIPLSFVDKDLNPHSESSDKLSEAVKYLSYNYEIQPYQLLTGNPIKVFIKKCIRKLGSFYFLPIVGQQNTLNFHFYQVSESIKDQREEIAELRRTVDELKAELDSVKGSNK